MITIPRWTVYPSVLVVVGMGVAVFPRPAEEEHAGAAASTRRHAAASEEPVGAAAVSDFEHKPIVVLGVDGLDPEILAATIEAYPEAMGNFVWLRDSMSGIQSLGTSIPPQSPVAWSNFITGRDPGAHGIFDFVHRDPVTRGQVAPTVTVEDGWNIPLPGEWTLAIPGASTPTRQGDAFWKVLADNGVPADIWRIPANFPVEPADGVSFPGMMTPVLDGSYGGATLYTAQKAEQEAKPFMEPSHLVGVQAFGGKIDTFIQGPHNPFKVAEAEAAQIPLMIYIDPQSGSAALDTGFEVLVLRPGEWSAFTSVTFDMLPAGMMPMVGITRFYVRSLAPFEMYMAPINFDPMAPATTISEPSSAATDLAKAIGPYYSQGMPEDVGALKEGILDDGEFLELGNLVYEERMRMLDYALDNYVERGEGGVLFFYFSTVDLTSHMMWRHSDPEHPAYDASQAATDSSAYSGNDGSTWGTTIYDAITKIDPALGQIRERLGDDVTYIVMSDHGFAPYRRKFHLNAWLLEEGYLVLRDGQEERLSNPKDKVHVFDKFNAAGDGETPDLRTVVDWSRTRAYGIGFNGLYLNLEGREQDDPATDEDERGIVSRDDADALLREIQQKLEALIDDDGTQVVLRCDWASEVYTLESDAARATSPDMIVGYNGNYGCSDESTLGQIYPRDRWIEDNVGGTFNGSHLMAPEVVPGTLLSNRPVRPGQHALHDLTVEILGRYGIEPQQFMNGHRVLED